MLNLITFNRWWDTNQVDSIYLRPYKRQLYKTLVEHLSARQVLVIYGLRRTGKTTLMYQIIDFLLKTGVNPKNVFYFSFDEKISTLEELLRNYSELITGKDLLKQGKTYIFLDEIQKLDNWENQLKIYYDLYPSIKFIISGSASITIAKRTKETLAGRTYEFILPLLSFREFLELKNETINFTLESLFDIKTLKDIYLAKERLAPYLIEYIKKGGFIELINEDNEPRIKDYAQAIIERAAFVDVVGAFKIKYPQHLKVILELISSNPGFLLDYTSMARTLSRDQRVIADYISYLKYTLLIKSLYNYSKSRFISERKLKKVYLGSTNFIYSFLPEKFTDPQFLGKVIENLVVMNSDSEFFWRQRNFEVDLILKDNTPVEIKFKESIDNRDLRSLLKFCNNYAIKKGVILTKDLLDSTKTRGVEILFVPVWMYLLKA